MNASRPYEQFLMQHLGDPEEAQSYLEAALEAYEGDGDTPAFLLALRHLAEARGGLDALADRTGLDRRQVHRILSPAGNPHLDAFDKILRGLGFRLAVQRITAPIP